VLNCESERIPRRMLQGSSKTAPQAVSLLEITSETPRRVPFSTT
jgi:hypothetical protein